MNMIPADWKLVYENELAVAGRGAHRVPPDDLADRGVREFEGVCALMTKTSDARTFLL